jgi:ATP-dependent Clp protease ATP-binding subunit ClpC
MRVDVKDSSIYPALKIYIQVRNFFIIIFAVFVSATLVSLFFYFYNVLELNESSIKGAMYLLGGSDLVLTYLYLFFKTKLRRSNLPLYTAETFEGKNIAEYLSFDAALPFYFAQDVSNNGFIDSRTLFAYCVETNASLCAFIFGRLGIDFNETRKNFHQFLGAVNPPDYPEHTETIIKTALNRAVEQKHEFIEITDILYSFILTSDFIKNSLFRIGVQPSDVAAIIYWKEMHINEVLKSKAFWRRENILKSQGYGHDLIFGYTPNLDRYCQDLTLRVKYMKFNLIGHNAEVESIGRILSKSGQNNVLIIGEPGGGRKTILYELVKRINEGQSEPELAYKRVVILNMNSLIGGLKTTGEITERVQKIFTEAQAAGNIVIAIDNFNNYVSSDPQALTANITPVLMPFLKSERLQLVGITDFAGFHKDIETNRDLLSQFERVEVEETTQEETFLILQNMAPKMEFMYRIMITIQALREMIQLSDLYIPNSVFPEKAINLLQEIAVYASDKRIHTVMPNLVAEYFSKKVGAPLGAVKEAEKEKLLNMETYLHKRVIGQAEAINVISDALRRARAGVEEKKRPIGTFLFMGPTGVGKTETAKALAEAYFGSEDKIVRFDMSEYSEASSIGRLVGSVQENTPGYLSTQIRENPFAVVLFDELEKAHKSVHDLLLQILDEGRFTDGFGQRVSFLSTLIIVTSNAGAEYLRELVNQGVDHTKIKKLILDYILKNGIFRPEFVNRFDAAVVFDIIERKDALKICELMLKKLSRRLQDNGYVLALTPELIEKVTTIGFDPIFGGRALRRVIQEKVEGKIAKEILEGKYDKGVTITINPAEIN